MQIPGDISCKFTRDVNSHEVTLRSHHVTSRWDDVTSTTRRPRKGPPCRVGHDASVMTRCSSFESRVLLVRLADLGPRRPATRYPVSGVLVRTDQSPAWKTRSMGFFSDVEFPADIYHEPEPRRVRWRGDPDDTVGVPVPLGPLLVRNDQVAVVSSGFLAYPSGFGFSLVSISRLDPAPLPFGFHPPGMRDRRGSTGGELRFGIGFADGSKVISHGHRPIPDDESSSRTLRPRGGGGGGRTWSQEFWCEPLPPAGLMALVIEWRDFGVPETAIDLDGSIILDAGSRALPLWPDDVDLPDEPSPRPFRSDSSWRSSSMRRAQP